MCWLSKKRQRRHYLSAQKKGPRKQRVPGGLRTSLCPGAIGRSAAAHPCAPCPRADGSFRQDPSLPCVRRLAWSAETSSRKELAPGADSAACRLMRDLVSPPVGIVPRVSDGGRIGHRQKWVKGDFLAGNTAISGTRKNFR